MQQDVKISNRYWDLLLATVTSCYRTPHSAIDKTQQELLFGENFNFKFNNDVKRILNAKERNEVFQQYLKILRDQMDIVIEKAESRQQNMRYREDVNGTRIGVKYDTVKEI